MFAFSLATLSGAVAQLLTKLNQVQSFLVDSVDWLVVFLTILEYAWNFRASPDRRRFVGEPSSVLSLIIILLAFGGLFFSSPILYSAPALRLVRAVKLSGETGRSSAELASESRSTGEIL